VPAKESSTQTSAKDLAIAAARMAADTRCTNVVLLDVSKVSPITDFLVIATGGSARQCGACATTSKNSPNPWDITH